MLCFKPSTKSLLHGFYASNMVLMIDSDTICPTLPNAKSRIAGYFYLSNYPSKTLTLFLNSATIVVCKALKHVLSSSAKTETAGV